MKQPLYISAACSISPQHTYDAENFLHPVVTTDDGKLYSLDTDYSKYISPVAIRRMSRILKQGITAGMKCIEDAGIKTPDAIIVGTARGSVTDMENFLKDMINMQEEALTPTGFIQSTYNSVNGWLAMLTKCTGYNQTFVHRGFSLELCLLDAQLLLAEATETKYILAGGFDELTEEYFTIRNKIEHYKDHPLNSFSLLSHYDTPGSIAGEGAHFFTLSNDNKGSDCAIYGIKMLQTPDSTEVQSSIREILSENGLKSDDVDILVCGMNGDNRNLFLIDPVIEGCAKNTTIVTFKQLSGEYDTSSGFGLWLTNYLFTNKQIPAELIYKQGASDTIKNILLVNVTISVNITIILLKNHN